MASDTCMKRNSQNKPPPTLNRERPNQFCVFRRWHHLINITLLVGDL